MPIPCPHFKISIVKRSQGQSAVAGAAYQSGERLFSEYDQRTKFYNKKKELVHAEIMLPHNAPPGYADRATLWNAVEAVENQWNSQLARRIVLAFPVEVPKEQYLKMIREFCQEQFVSKGMIADFAIHDKGDGNPHAHILLTIRAMDEHGKWLPKARKVYDLDENGERIRLPSGNWKCHKENTVDWNDQKYAEVWRHSWETITNRYLEAAGRPERVDLRSFERQGIPQIPTVHLGPAAHQMEKRGVETFLGNLNRDIRAANSLMQSIRSAIRGLQRWIADLNEKKQLLLDALEKSKEPTLSDLLMDYFNLRNEQRSDWSGKAKLKCTVRDFEEVKRAVDYLKAHSLNAIEDLDTAISNLNQTTAPLRRQLKQNENRMRAIAQIKDAAAVHAKLKPIENNARLVIIDPIQAYLGADVDMNRANEVRPIFMRLGQVAQRTGCAILLIGHLNKAAGMQSLQRGLGSIDIAAAVRSVMFIGKLKHDPTMRILTHEKSSLAPPGVSLAFSLGDEGGFRWVGEYDITADEMLSGIEPQRETKTQQAKDLICTLLAGGKQVLSEDIDKAALERGIPGRTVRDAKRELGDALKSKIVEGRKKVFWME